MCDASGSVAPLKTDTNSILRVSRAKQATQNRRSQGQLGREVSYVIGRDSRRGAEKNPGLKTLVFEILIVFGNLMKPPEEKEGSALCDNRTLSCV